MRENQIIDSFEFIEQYKKRVRHNAQIERIPPLPQLFGVTSGHFSVAGGNSFQKRSLDVPSSKIRVCLNFSYLCANDNSHANENTSS